MDVINYSKIKKVQQDLETHKSAYANQMLLKADKTYVDNQIAINDARIDEIITTPAEGVSAQEIIDARQGKASVGANLTAVKEQINSVDAQLAQIATDITHHKNVYFFDRMPTDLTEYDVGSLILIKENILSNNPSDWEVGSIHSTNGGLVGYANRIRTKNFIDVEPNTKYQIDFLSNPSGAFVVIFEYTEADEYLSHTDWQSTGYVFTSQPTTSKLKIIIRNPQNSDFTDTLYITETKPVLSRIY
jgi:hypothetical protein